MQATCLILEAFDSTLLYVLFLTDYDRVAAKAGKLDTEVKRLHNLIIEINNNKLKVHQGHLDKINNELDQCASTVTKAQVAIKTANRYDKYFLFFVGINLFFMLIYITCELNFFPLQISSCLLSPLPSAWPNNTITPPSSASAQRV